MTNPRIAASDYAITIDERRSKGNVVVFEITDTRRGGGGRFVATRSPGGVGNRIEVEALGGTTHFMVWEDEPLPFERWEVSPGRTIEDWRGVTTEELLEMTSVEDAWQNFRNDDHGKQNETKEPWQGLRPPLGAIGFDPVCNDFAVLLWLDTETVEPAEPEDGIKHHATYKQYLKWARFGLQPPPMAAWDHANSQGELGRKIRTGGRRRTLAAQEAGRRGLLCWWSPTSKKGVAKWRLEDDDPQVGYYRERHRQWTRRSQNGQGG